MEAWQVKELIREELPMLVQSDADMQRFIRNLSRGHFADHLETESRFDMLLDELRRDREEQSRKWQEESHRWEEQSRKWQEESHKWDEQERRWAENQQVLRQMQANFEDGQKRIEENQKRIEENQKQIGRLIDSVEKLGRKHDSTSGALGARWGLYTEESFRSALRGILEDSFDVAVINVTEYDDEGEVFGRPDQVELDLIIKNGLLIIAEIKSSTSKSDMYAFVRKVRFYEKRHNRQASRKLVISPMVDSRAQAIAEELGVEVYSYADTVAPEVFSQA